MCFLCGVHTAVTAAVGLPCPDLICGVHELVSLPSHISYHIQRLLANRWHSVVKYRQTACWLRF
jgi:hypothetical protein